MQRMTFLAALAGLALAGAGPAFADISIGTAGPLSNAEALFGNTWQNGMQLAINEVNAAGGINGQKLVLVRQDDQGDPKQGTLLAQKFCDNSSILAVIANFNSGVTIPSSDVYNRCGMPQVTNSSNPKVTAAGYANLFRPIANDFMQGGAPATYALKTLGAKTAAVVHDKQAFGQGVATVFRDDFEKGGGKITSYSGVTATDVDFSALITKLKTENPAVVYYGGTMPGVGLFLKQLRELGVKSTFFAADPAFLPDLITTAGQANAAGAIVSFQAPPYDANPKLVKFRDNYKKVFNEEPGPYSAYGYNEASVIIEAMKRAGTSVTRETIAKEIRNTKLDGLMGTVEFDDKGELKDPSLFLYKVEDGKFVLEWPKGGS
ncbi:MAG: branched-chain amino acid ABC transporter substrate-binding protein [Methylobacteriaceae bacterium]|nr:branched-chain amino acid ABC transporter substrate-binding protein [Methylobacteriaceae bacterium]